MASLPFERKPVREKGYKISFIFKNGSGVFIVSAFIDSHNSPEFGRGNGEKHVYNIPDREETEGEAEQMHKQQSYSFP